MDGIWAYSSASVLVIETQLFSANHVSHFYCIFLSFSSCHKSWPEVSGPPGFGSEHNSLTRCSIHGGDRACLFTQDHDLSQPGLASVALSTFLLYPLPLALQLPAALNPPFEPFRLAHESADYPFEIPAICFLFTSSQESAFPRSSAPCIHYLHHRGFLFRRLRLPSY